ncbi:putative acyl-[acyl-carrier-] desaturase desA1 domain protein [Mycobacterium xenopi 4042]|uniref:Putative acyl-[acyl-carrier-] desaturase desA1 domain protein n=1 Tax=Mycobacterium xenopi 4042 TaxID=1299334 RepID=X7ZWW1_MYCXE|nr:putative acyl-[acyl-carrier-] desaturase desA1 domain protein [Mycobacterium xenopi 4042]
MTRAVDPVELEKLRIEVVNRGFSPARTIRVSISPSVSPTRSST